MFMSDDFSLNELAQQAFEAMTEALAWSDQIGNQNMRFDEISQIFADEPEIKDIAQIGVAREQEEAFANLLETTQQYGGLYEVIGQLSIDAARDFTDAQTELAMVEEDLRIQEELLQAKRAQKLAYMTQRSEEILLEVARLSPTSVEEVRKMLEERSVYHGSDPEITKLEEDILRLMERAEDTERRLEDAETELEATNTSMSKFSKEWSIPWAIINSGRTLQVLIDELPIDPKLSSQEHERFQELHRRNVDQPEATLYASLYLSQYPDKTITVDELAVFLYSSEVISGLPEHSLRSRVTTLLGPVGGESVRDILASEGFVLQYGWRRMLEQKIDGHIVTTSRKRIYRAIRKSDIASRGLPEVDISNDYVDEFQTVSNLPNIEISAKIGHIKETLQSSANPSITKPRPEIVVDKWEKLFKSEVGTAINLLEEEGLLISEEGEFVKHARIKSKSSVFATRTAIQNISRAGLTGRFRALQGTQIAESIVTPAEMVYMRLYNTHREILGRGHPKQKRAIAVIEESLRSYFAAREERSSE